MRKTCYKYSAPHCHCLIQLQGVLIGVSRCRWDGLPYHPKGFSHFEIMKALPVQLSVPSRKKTLTFYSLPDMSCQSVSLALDDLITRQPSMKGHFSLRMFTYCLKVFHFRGRAFHLTTLFC